MADDVKAWQRDALRAFDFVADLYAQAQTVFDDAHSLFDELDWEVSDAGTAQHSSLRDAPFVYLKVLEAYVKGTADGATGSGAFLAILFHGSSRKGPSCIAGSFAWSDTNARFDHWLVLGAIGNARPPSFVGTFDISPGPVHLASPTQKGKKERPGIDRVSWFEVPLGAISSGEVLRDVVTAAQAMVSGDEEPARAVVAALDTL